MSNQNPKELIKRASWSLMEGIKDTVAVNVIAAARQGTIELKKEHLTVLLTVINASIEEGFHKVMRIFSRTVDAAVDDVVASASPKKKPA